MKKAHLLFLFCLFLPANALADDFSDLMNRGHGFWEKRDHQAELLQAIEFYEKALILNPLDEVLLARLSRAYYWKGMNFPEDKKKERMDGFRKGMTIGERLLELNPENIAGNFWFASNEARFGAEKGIFKSLSCVPDLKTKVNFVLEKQPSYHYGAPHRFLAKFSQTIPGLLRKRMSGYTLEEAVVLLKDSLKIEPDFTMTYLFLGDIYAEIGETDLAKNAYQTVLAIPENAIPECAAENRRDKKEAVKALKRIEK